MENYPRKQGAEALLISQLSRRIKNCQFIFSVGKPILSSIRQINYRVFRFNMIYRRIKRIFHKSKFIKLEQSDVRGSYLFQIISSSVFHTGVKLADSDNFLRREKAFLLRQLLESLLLCLNPSRILNAPFPDKSINITRFEVMRYPENWFVL